jgi:hypothetical protein
LVIVPLSVSTIGLGGFIGTNTNPTGDIIGRRLEAQAVVTAMARDAGNLNMAVASIATALLTDRGALNAAGIVRMALMNSGAGSDSPAVAGGNPAVQREMTFQLTFEFLKTPSAAGDLIQEIPIGIQLDQT